MKLYFSESVTKNSLLASRSYSPSIARALIAPMSEAAWALTRAATLEYAGGQTAAAIDHPEAHYFMDVGVWAGGPAGRPMTTFGLVCDRHLLICSWMNLQEGGRLYRDLERPGMTQRINRGPTIKVDEWAKSLPGPMKSFLATANEDERGFVLAACRAAEPFTGSNEMIVALGDVHLHFQAGGPFDRFRFGQPLVSLDRELKRLLDLAKGFGAQTVQCGDMYEAWECEVICRAAFDKLTALAGKAYGSDHSRWDNDLRWLYENRRVPMQMFLRGESAEIANLESLREFRHFTSTLPGGAPWPGPTAAPVLSAWTEESIRIDSTASINAAIRAAHPDLFDGATRLFTHEILGNHDNNLAARPQHDDEGKVRIGALEADPGDTRTKELRLGDGGCVWFEHGHHYDFHNADEYWRDEGRGYSMVEKLIRGVGFQTMSYWKGVKIAASDGTVHRIVMGSTAEKDNLLRSVGDIYMDTLDAEMRFPTLLRCDEVLMSQRGEVRLVVMGHTHTPCLVEGPRGRSLFWTHPHAQAYLDQSSCLDDARSLANTIKPPAP